MERRAWLLGWLSLLAARPAAEAQAPAKVFRIGLLAGEPPTHPEARHVWERSSRDCSDTSRANEGAHLTRS
jgi:hypothetical protein